MKTLRYIDDVTTLAFEVETCVGCGRCQEVCPHQVFKLRAKKAEIVDRNACIECGACATNCPVAAITVIPGVGCASYIIKRWIKGKDAYIECC
jgi:NAD-dependent dihydropyrimidine dehydrogenase PreA subunit